MKKSALTLVAVCLLLFANHASGQWLQTNQPTGEYTSDQSRAKLADYGKMETTGRNLMFGGIALTCLSVVGPVIVKYAADAWASWCNSSFWSWNRWNTVKVDNLSIITVGAVCAGVGIILGTTGGIVLDNGYKKEKKYDKISLIIHPNALTLLF